MIEEVNSLSAPTHHHVSHSLTPSARDADSASQMPDDPINQLSAILGAHLRALNSIDGNAGRLEVKVKELEGKMGGGEKRFAPRR